MDHKTGRRSDIKKIILFIKVAGKVDSKGCLKDRIGGIDSQSMEGVAGLKNKIKSGRHPDIQIFIRQAWKLLL